MKFSNQLIWALISMLRTIFSILPLRISISIGSMVGKTVWFFSRKRVDAAEARAVRALGIGITSARKIVKNSYANLGRSAAEILRMSRGKLDIDNLVKLHGEENLEKAFNLNRGVIFLTAHFGNWEILAAHVASKGYPMNAIGAEQRDARITDLIINTRELYGVHTISRGFDLKSAIRCLREKQILGVLIDQDVRDKGIIAPFIGLPASTPYGPFKMSNRIGSPVLPVFIIRRDNGIHHDIYILEPLKDSSGKDFGSDLEDAVIVANKTLSEWIEKKPDHWMWLYSRWVSTMGD